MATTWYNLRETDTEIAVAQGDLALQRKTLDSTTSRHQNGVAPGFNLAQQ